MLNLYAECFIDQNKHTIHINSKSGWDVERDGTEPGYNLFLDFVSNLILYVNQRELIFTNSNNGKSLVNLKSDSIEEIKWYLSLEKKRCEWIFFLMGDEKYCSCMNDLIPYFVEKKPFLAYIEEEFFEPIDPITTIVYHEAYTNLLEVSFYQGQSEFVNKVIQKALAELEGQIELIEI